MKTKVSHFSVYTAVLSAVLCLTGMVGIAQSIPTLDSEQLAFLTLINTYRAQNGAGPLQVSIALENSSQWMSNDMASNNYFGHTDSLGRDPFTRMAAFGYPYGSAGENIAAGRPDAQTMFNAWQTACDPGASGQCTYQHRQNMLNPSFVVIGIGRAFNIASTYQWYWTTDFGGFLDATIPIPSTNPPAIISFSAAPSEIMAGQRSTLTWSVSGANTVSLDNGIGDVSTLTSTSVSPAQTTTYTLTATNSAGSTTAVATVTVGTQTPPPGGSTSIWPNSTTPTIPSAVISNPTELGVKFRSDISGAVAGIRFYKGVLNTGTHTGSLWSSTGTLLASGTFTNESSSGWQTLLFSSPVAIAANTIYVASYHSSGVFAVDFGYFLTHGADNAPLHALQSGVDGPNGVFLYSSGGQFPTMGNGDNYWVDVVFGGSGTGVPPPPPPPTPQSIVVMAGSSQSAAVGATFAVPLQVEVLDGSSNPLSGITVTFSAPTSGASSTFAGSGSSAVAVTNAQGVAVAPALTANNTVGTYTVTASAGSLAPAIFTLSNTAAGAPPPPPTSNTSIWPNSTTPTIPSAVTSNPMELGVKLRSDISGAVAGIRFYKGVLNTGTHTGSLWSSTGTLLATGTFTNESSSGWQTLLFSSPVAIAANTTYVASYHSSGVFAVDFGYFQSHGADNAPLHALQSGVSGPNGVFIYSSGGQFPTSGSADNYWVDVVFNGAGPGVPPTPRSIIAVAGSSQSAAVGAAFAVPLQVEVLDGSSNPLSGITVTFSAPTSGAGSTFAGSGSSATVLTNAQGVAVAPALTANNTVGSYAVAASAGTLAPVTFTLSNTAAGTPPQASGNTSIWPNSTTPTIPSAVTSNPSELGVKFRSDISGAVAGIRFYKGVLNTGTHTGSLWSSTGTLLATGTFTSETSSGWQTLLFSAPVTISANTPYVASDHSSGVFAVDFGYFQSHGADNTPLHALQSGVDGPNGVFIYSPGGQFPTNGSVDNYWVDVVFQGN